MRKRVLSILGGINFMIGFIAIICCSSVDFTVSNEIKKGILFFLIFLISCLIGYVISHIYYIVGYICAWIVLLQYKHNPYSFSKKNREFLKYYIRYYHYRFNQVAIHFSYMYNEILIKSDLIRR